MSIKSWWSSLAAKQNDNNAYFRISDEHIIDTHTDGSADQFVPGCTYFEVRLKQMFLKNRREWAREFLPLTSSNIEFQFLGERVSVPMVLGQNSLNNMEKITRGDEIEFLNTRIVGPCPYEGEDIELFLGLFRMVTNDWTKQTLSLLEGILKIVDSSRISSFLNLAGPLSSGLEGFLGMEDLEMRIGQRVQYASPVAGQPARVGVLRPSFEVSLLYPRAKLTSDMQRKFWVKEGRLFCGDSEHELTEFTDTDYLLIQIAPLRVRHDYTGFDFHKRHWKRIEELLPMGKQDEAFETFKLLAASLVQCDDIIQPQRIGLLENYRKKMDESIKFYKKLFSPSKNNRRESMRGAVERDRQQQLTEADLLSAVEAQGTGEESLNLSPEQMMKRFTK